MIIRKAGLQDLNDIVRIERLCFPEETAFPAGMFAYLIRHAQALVALDIDGRMMGFIVGYASGRTGVIYTLDVDPEFRRKGVGTRLLNDLEEQFRSKGAAACRLEAAVENPAALGLYRKQGYRDNALIKNYYGRGKNAFRLRKRLKSTTTP